MSQISKTFLLLSLSVSTYAYFQGFGNPVTKYRFSAQMSQTEAIESINLKLSLLKTQLFSAISTCDRGFGATTNDRQTVLKLVDKMKQLCQENCPTRGLYPYNNFNETETNTTGNTGILESTPELTIPVPIDGVWKMAFTNAYDVVSLAANPLSQIQGIYQVRYIFPFSGKY